MKPIITEEMRFRKRLCDYALKHGVTKAARKYHTYRQFVYRQLEKYDNFTAKFVGEKVQIDIKYVPVECILFLSYGVMEKSIIRLQL